MTVSFCIDEAKLSINQCTQVGILLINAVISIYFYFVYKRRERRQMRTYHQVQLKLIEQIKESEGDCSHLKEAFIREFSASAVSIQ